MPPIAVLLPFVTDILDKIFPDKEEADKAKLEMLKLAQEGRLVELNAMKEVDLAQAATNTAEAQSDSFFKSGWRPFSGWTAGIGLSYQFVAFPILHGYFPLLQPIDTEQLMWLLTGMLGLGGLRTYEKMKK
jgi:hypothetical protein